MSLERAVRRECSLRKLDLDSYCDRVREAGARIADPLAPRPRGQREFTVEDAAGNWLTFWSKV